MNTLQTTNSAIYGRKIFFVCATFTLNTNIILRLMQQEFEIYKIDEYRQLKSILQLTPDAIVYINADSQNTPNVWFNYISAFEKDPQFKNVDFGVFAGKLKAPEIERYSKALKLSAGFYTLDKSFGDIMGRLMQKLDDIKAKGMRRFVRMNCSSNKSTEAYFVNGNMMYKMKLLDISSIGIGLKIPAKYGQIVQPNAVLHGLTLVLGPKQLKVNAKIHAAKMETDGILTVLIFTPDTTDDFRNYVRNYICEELQKDLLDTVITLPWDKTDYTIEIKQEEPKEEKSEETAEPTEDNDTSAEEEKDESNTQENDETAPVKEEIQEAKSD